MRLSDSNDGPLKIRLRKGLSKDDLNRYVTSLQSASNKIKLEDHPWASRADRTLVMVDDKSVVGQLEFDVWGEKIVLTSVQVDPAFRNKGYAKAILKVITDTADNVRLPLMLNPKAYGPDPKLTGTQLKSLYKKYGFRQSPDDLDSMERNPK